MKIIDTMKVEWLEDHNDLYKCYDEETDIILWLRKNTFDEFVYKEIFINKQYYIPKEKPSRLIEYFEKYKIGEPKVIVDIGANIGLSCLYFHSLYPNSEIYAVEPEIDNFEMLKLNTKNLKIHNYNMAIWRENEQAYIQDKSEFMTKKGKLNTARYTINANSGRKISSTTMLNFFKECNLDFVDILKVDIQGSEIEVFDEQSYEWLKKVRILFVEQHDYYRFGCSKQIMKALSQLKFYFIGSRGKEGEILMFLILEDII